MRLTLRTLLAYLDDLLEPNDARELGGKVRESEFASSLVHRIRSVTGRLRLSAPNVLGRGVGADANSVAEYLDNTFPAERVPEFEKVCLESDMHLAEVASCHHVLTLVLGEPAQVSARLRERIHGLLPAPNPNAEAAPPSRPLPQTRVDSPVRRETIPTAEPIRRTTAGASLPTGHRRDSWRGGDEPVHEPDYVAAGRRRGMPGWLVALLFGFVITGATILGTIVLRDRSPQLASAPSSTEPAVGALGDVSELDQQNAGTGQAGDVAVANPPTSPAIKRNSDFQPDTPGVPLAPALMPAPNGNKVATDNGDFVAEPTAAGQPPFSPNNLASSGSTEGTAGLPPASPTNESAQPVTASGTENGNALNLPPASATLPVEEASTETMNEADAHDEKTEKLTIEPVQQPAKEKDLGRFVSEDQVLAVWDEIDQAWLRLPPRSALLDGIHLRVPALYRPQLVMGNGLQITLNDVTDVLLTSENDGRTRIKLDFGQTIVSTINGEAQEVVMDASGERISVKLLDGLSQFAAEVRSLRMPGTEPLNAKPRAITQIWPTGGTVEIQRGENAAEMVAAGNVWVLDGQSEVRPLDKLPQWISAPQRKEIDRHAQFRLANEIGMERALTLSLAEAAADGPPEIRSLAARSLAALDRFDPLIESFADPKQHFAWTSHFQSLLDAASRSPQTAKIAQTAAQQHWGADFERMWRMLIGYNPEKLGSDGAGELVTSLADENLTVRVLAIETLRSITGVDYFFEPQRPSRRRALRRWQLELEANRIEYKDWPPTLEN